MQFKIVVVGISILMIMGLTDVQAKRTDFSACDGQSGEELRLCKGAVARGCGELPTNRLRTCERIEERYRAMTGEDVPPWLVVPNPDSTAQLTPVNLMVPFNPQPVRGNDGKYHLVYELQILNFGAFGPEPAPPPPATIVIEEVTVFGDDPNGDSILVLEGQPLVERMQLLHLSARFPGELPPLELQPAQSAVVFLDITFEERDAVPRSLTNRVTISAVGGTGPDPIVKIVDIRIEVDPTPVVVIGPFLRGRGWANLNGCCDFGNSAHRRVVRSVNGAEYFPERYAEDVLKTNAEFKFFSENGDEVDEWFGTGAEVLSVADGVVTRVVVGLENNPIGQFPFPPVLNTGGGNEVLVHIGEGIYAMYGHLLPGTVHLKVGDRISRGDVVGLLGNTGVSGAPHLHFQVMDANSIGKAQGLPFVFDEFEMIGTFDDIDETWGLEGLNVLPVPERRYNEMPLQNTIVRFR